MEPRVRGFVRLAQIEHILETGEASSPADVSDFTDICISYTSRLLQKLRNRGIKIPFKPKSSRLKGSGELRDELIKAGYNAAELADYFHTSEKAIYYYVRNHKMVGAWKRAKARHAASKSSVCLYAFS